MKHLLKQLTIAAFTVACTAIAHADTIDFSASITGTVSLDPAGRCAPVPTINSAGTGAATLLGDFVDVQSDCMTSPFTFDQGLFAFTSLLIPENSLFGTYFAVAAPQDDLLALTSILVVTGGTGAFANEFGAIFGLETLDRTTGNIQ